MAKTSPASRSGIKTTSVKGTTDLFKNANNSLISSKEEKARQKRVDQVEFLFPHISDHGAKVLKAYPALGKSAADTVAEIKATFREQAKTAGRVGVLLNKLHNLFLDYIPATKTNSSLGESLYYRFISVEFALGKSRTNEYLFLARRKDINQLDLPLSVLIELTRINELKVKGFLKKNPIESLKKLSYREVQELVKKMNPNRRNRKKQKKSRPSTSFASKIANEKSAITRINGLKSSFRSFYSKEKMGSRVKSEIQSFLKWFNSTTKKVG